MNPTESQTLGGGMARGLELPQTTGELRRHYGTSRRPFRAENGMRQACCVSHTMRAPW